MGTMASKITSLAVVYLTVYSGVDKKNIKAPRHWPLCGEFTGDRWIPAQMASNVENVSNWWRHNAKKPNSKCFTVDASVASVASLHTYADA